MSGFFYGFKLRDKRWSFITSQLSLPSMKKALLLLLLAYSFICEAQQRFPTLSPEASIELITIGPGPELYDAFGHTSVRVKDVPNKIDMVFNYGVFDFDTPNFYLKFARGKLLYKLAAAPYKNFEYSYKAQQRWIKSQELNLNQQEKQDTYEFLLNNLDEANRYYKYDFFYDNCATRPYYAVASSVEGSLALQHTGIDTTLTHRDLIRQYVPWNSWGSLGIDVALGSLIDRVATPEEHLFLPNELMASFKTAQVTSGNSSKALVKNSQTIFEPSFIHSYGVPFYVSPLFILGLIALFIIYKTYKDFKANNGIGWLDSTLLLFAGVTGVLVAFLWFGTDHIATAWNYNILWAFPFHILAAFAVKKVQPARWIYPYMKLAVILMCLLFAHWAIGVQSYAPSLLPLLIAITVRYIYILRNIKLTREE